MHIVKLTAENVKRLRAVTIRPDGSLVQITGRNGAGKSSVLDAISYALAGKKAQPSEPVRRGARKAKVVLELDDLTVTRTWTAGGGTYLGVEGKNGAKYSSPQAVLDKLVGELTFDPCAFARMTPHDQSTTLKQVAGLEAAFDELDAQRAGAYDRRTDVNRDVKRLEAQLADMWGGDAPDDEVSIADLTRQQAAALEVIRNNDRARQQVEGLKQRIANGNNHVAALATTRQRVRAEDDERIARLEAELAKARATRDAHEREADATAKQAADLLQRLQGELADAERTVAGLSDPDTATIAKAIQDVEQTNQRVRAKKDRTRRAAELAELQAQSQALTDRIGSIDQQKQDALAAAKLPVAGLGFGDEGVTFNGLPFDQASAAEQLRVSVAMGIALNPRLRIMLIRDGSLLDADSLATLAAMANEHDVQVWLERVADGQPVGIVIEDGQVVGAAEPAEPEGNAGDEVEAPADDEAQNGADERVEAAAPTVVAAEPDADLF